MSKLLAGEKIEKSFGRGGERCTALSDVSLEIEEGEFAAIMGASGSGKSTLLYLLSGMDRPDRGEISFRGKNLSDLSDDALSDLRRSEMGFVFQQPTLLKNLNLLDNILLPQMRDNRKRIRSLTERAEALMEQVGIAGLGQRDITQVSGGQLQRAGICRALMSRPKIIFADEPTGALNSKSSDEILTLFSGIQKTGTAILLVTHDPKVAARAKRVLFMRDGRIVSSIALPFSRPEELPRSTGRILSEMDRLGI